MERRRWGEIAAAGEEFARAGTSGPSGQWWNVGSATGLEAWYNPGMDGKLLSRITIEPGKCGGKPCIRGKRMRVTDVLDLLGAGAPFEEILQDYPFLERDDILAALTYAARQTDHVVLKTA